MNTILKIMFLIFITVYFSGCASANLIKERYEPKGGVVAYSNSKLRASSSLEKAKEIMTNYCAPVSYSINERAYQSNVVGYSLSKGAFSGVNATPVYNHVVYLDFKCEGS